MLTVLGCAACNREFGKMSAFLITSMGATRAELASPARFVDRNASTGFFFAGSFGVEASPLGVLRFFFIRSPRHHSRRRIASIRRRE
jgi:hypothetical protein